MSEVEVFLDEGPLETRGVIARDGLYETLLIQRTADAPALRLGARSIGRVASMETGLGGAFIDLGVSGAPAFLKFPAKTPLKTGQKLEVEVTAEPRADKGAILRLIAPGEGDVRLTRAGPDVRSQLLRLAHDMTSGAEIITGMAAIQAGQEAEDDALAVQFDLPSAGINLAIEQTRALTAVDIDFTGLVRGAGAARDPRRARLQANGAGLHHAARLIRLKGLGGLVVVDLVGGGAGQDGQAILDLARKAFVAKPDGAEGIVFGPVSRLGLFQLSLPWRRTPVRDRLFTPAGSLFIEARAARAVQRLRYALLSDTATARLVLACAPDEAAYAKDAVAQLGPRAHLRADPAIAAGASVIQEA